MRPDHYIGPKQHALIMGCLLLAAIALACAPHALLGVHYECVLHRLTGIRCPFCGMTRDFILMTHGSLPQNNPGSLFLALALYIVYPVWILVASVARHSTLLLDREKLVNVTMLVMAGLLICNNLSS